MVAKNTLNELANQKKQTKEKNHHKIETICLIMAMAMRFVPM